MEIIALINIGENNNRYLYRLCRHDGVLVWQFNGYVWSYSEYSFVLSNLLVLSFHLLLSSPFNTLYISFNTLKIYPQFI